jgi:hypothetical protein
MKFKPLYIWWLVVLASATAFFWAYQTGLAEVILFKDVTYITSIIAVAYVVTLGFLGKIAYTIEEEVNVRLIRLCLWISEQMLALGMLGTVIGFIHLLQSASSHCCFPFLLVLVQHSLQTQWASWAVSVFVGQPRL